MRVEQIGAELRCQRCQQMLPTSEFKPDDRYRRGHTSWCHECHRARNREWYAANKAKQNAKSKRWAKQNKEASLQISQRHHQANKTKRGKQHAEWARQNKGKRNATAAKRKAAKLRATPNWANWEKVQEIYREAKRLEKQTGVARHVDHIVPLQGKTVCGLHWEGNLQIISATENMRKKNRWDDSISEARRQSDLFVALPAEQVAMDL